MPPMRQLTDLTPHVQLTAQTGLLLLDPLVLAAQTVPQQTMQTQKKLSRHPFRQRQGKKADIRFASLPERYIQHL